MNLDAGILLMLGGVVSVILFLLFYKGKSVSGGGGQSPDFAKLSLAANKTDYGVLLVGPDGTIEWVNPAFTRITGYEKAEAKDKAFGTLLLGSLHSPKVTQQIKTGLSGKKGFNLEMLCAHKQGHRYWLSLNLTPVCDERDRLVSFVGVATDMTMRKRVEDDLARTNRRNEMFLNSAGEGIFGLDLHGAITFVNPAAARMTGWDSGELIGKPASTILHQLRIAKPAPGQEAHFLASTYQDGTVLVGDADQFKRKDGTIFPVEYTSAAIREGNNITGAVFIFRDVTDRKQTENVRSRQTRQYALRADIGFALAGSDALKTLLQRCAQALIKHLDGAFARIWTLNPDENLLELQASAGLYTRTDGNYSRLAVGNGSKVGLIARDRIPQMTNDLINDDQVSDRDWVKREQMVAFVGFPLFVENRLVGVLAMFSKNPLPADTFEMLGAVTDSIAQGIVRKRAEDKVAEQAALLDKSQDAICVIDLSHRFTYWNKSAERLYGWSAKDACGKTADELLFRDRSYFDRAKKEVLEKGEWKGECCQVTSGDESVIVESQWTMVPDETGRPKSILMVNTDVSEKRKIEAQFLRTQRMESIGTLAGGIAHDLNNVLSPIMMSVEILKEKFKDDQSKRMLGILESSARRGADMVKQVLTFARGVDGERVLLQTKHVVKEVAKIVMDTFPKTIQLKTNVAENLWTIMGDATQLHQVMVNLTVNARDAMPEGGTLTITAENTIVDAAQENNPASAKPGFYVVIKVKDSGTGIPREVLDKIFEPFFTTKEMGKGTGLGLATVLGIVKSHGGFVQVQTEVNKGTTFLIYLPALEGAPQPQAETEDRRPPSGNGELLLAVDDEAAVLSITKETLENFGYRVVTAKDGTEAVAVYTAHRNEIKGVLTDMLMPFMDGPATIRVLKKMDPNVRIIASSGLMDNEKVKNATGMDNIAFLMKPYTADKLLQTVHKVLSE